MPRYSGVHTDGESAWQSLGRTPLHRVRVERGSEEFARELGFAQGQALRPQFAVKVMTLVQ